MAEGILAKIAAAKRADVHARLNGISYDPPPTERSLSDALSRPGARFIMEVKKASPSGHRSSAGVEEAVGAYAPLADAISVLTDGPYFNGSLEDLRTVRSRFAGPILAKDFIVEPRQVAEARAHGADAVLAILGMLDDSDAAAVMGEAKRLSMDVIVEVHDEMELNRAIALRAGIIGINNRDLRTLITDLAVTERLAGLVPADVLVISESGICDRRDTERLSSRVDAFLVGSSLMAARDIGEAARALVFGRVKICGLTTPEDAALAARCGASHAGLIFANSLRKVSLAARAIVEAARAIGAKPVGVFKDQGMEFVARTARDLELAAVQLHGSEKGLAAYRRALPETCELWATCAVDGGSAVEREGADRILYDTMIDGRSGGTGTRFDWSIVEGRAALPSAFVAGGIGPGNARAAQALGAHGIDLCSGVEDSPGRKDPASLVALFDALRLPCRRTA